MRMQILAHMKRGLWMRPSEIATASGVERGKLSYQLSQLVAQKHLLAQGTTSTRRYALAGADAPDAGTITRKAKTKPPKRETKPHKTATKAPPKTKAQPQKAAACNVQPFEAAMTADHRMVIIGGAEPLIFSVEQTQSIADLVLENFEAA